MYVGLKMAIIYGELDSFKQLQNHFKSANINFLSSLDKVMFFKEHYEEKMVKKEAKTINEVKQSLNLEIEQEKEEVLNLEKIYNENIEDIQKLLIAEKDQIHNKIQEIYSKSNSIIAKFKVHRLKNKENDLNDKFKIQEQKLIEQLKSNINSKNNNINHILNNYKLLVDKKVEKELFVLKRAKKILDSNYDLFLGAIGEQKALNALKELPDTFTIINDFKLKLNKPIYNKNTDERIYSIQADHIVVGSSGVFLIETKNWSKDSINNSNLYSPVEQVKRSSFGLFCYLNNSNSSFLQSNWGKKKIPIKNIVLMTGAKPKGEFEYVKVCGLNEVCGYIKYFKSTLNNQEVSEIIDSLTNISYSYKPATKKYTSLHYTPLINRRNIRMARKISRWLG